MEHKFDIICVYNGRVDIVKHGHLFKNLECQGIFDKEKDTVTLLYRTDDDSYQMLENVRQYYFPKFEFKDYQYKNPYRDYIGEDGEIHHYVNQAEWLHDLTIVVDTTMIEKISEVYSLFCFGAECPECKYIDNRDVFHDVFFEGSESIKEIWNKWHVDLEKETTEEEWV